MVATLDARGIPQGDDGPHVAVLALAVDAFHVIALTGCDST